jgi:hypothetical protein
MPALCISDRTDADCANDDAPDQISLRRKAHLSPC